MPGYVNYYYNKDGKLPGHTKATFKEYEILTVHGVIIIGLQPIKTRAELDSSTV